MARAADDPSNSGSESAGNMLTITDDLLRGSESAGNMLTITDDLLQSQSGWTRELD